MITINVTDKHYQNGVRCSSYKCAVALALNETTGLEWCVGSWYIFPAASNHHIPIPDHVRVVINEFDNHVLPDQITWELPITVSDGKAILDEDTNVQSSQNQGEHSTPKPVS